MVDIQCITASGGRGRESAARGQGICRQGRAAAKLRTEMIHGMIPTGMEWSLVMYHFNIIIYH